MSRKLSNAEKLGNFFKQTYPESQNEDTFYDSKWRFLKDLNEVFKDYELDQPNSYGFACRAMVADEVEDIKDALERLGQKEEK